MSSILFYVFRGRHDYIYIYIYIYIYSYIYIYIYKFIYRVNIIYLITLASYELTVTVKIIPVITINYYFFSIMYLSLSSNVYCPRQQKQTQKNAKTHMQMQVHCNKASHTTTHSQNHFQCV